MPFPKRLNRLEVVWLPAESIGDWVIRWWPLIGSASEVQVRGTRREVEAMATRIFVRVPAHSVHVFQSPVTAQSVQVYRLQRETGGKSYVEIRRRASLAELSV